MKNYLLNPKLKRGLQINHAGRILVIECGATETAQIGNENPECAVVGIDSSESSIEICQKILDANDIKNVELMNVGFMDFMDIVGYNMVVVSDVINTEAFISKIYNNHLLPESILVGVVNETTSKKEWRDMLEKVGFIDFDTFTIPEKSDRLNFIARKVAKVANTGYRKSMNY